MNVLVLHWLTNTIMHGFHGVSDDQRLLIEHAYRERAFKVVKVCDAIYRKYLTLAAKHETTTINQLVRVSTAFLREIKRLSPRKRRSVQEAL